MPKLTAGVHEHYDGGINNVATTPDSEDAHGSCVPDLKQGQRPTGHPMQDTERTATFSPCREYRYALWRNWQGMFDGKNGYAMFIGLNPSTADETEDDPTIRRCVAFAKRWGYDGLCMTNLFGFRATDPDVMLAKADPVGPDNDRYLVEMARNAGVVVAAWGTPGTHMARNATVRKLIANLHYLRLTKDGHPGHPLYLPGDLTPTLWAT